MASPNANNFFPAGVQIFYHSPFAPHVQTLHTLTYSPEDDSFITWNGGTVDSDTMINDLVATFLPLYEDDVVFDSYRIYTADAENSLPVLRKIANFTGVVGTNAGGTWRKAAQGTLSALGEDGSKARIVFLDFNSADDWDGIFTLTGSVLPPIMAAWGDLDAGWATKADSRPATFLEFSKTLNEKLRREYHMF